jgi:signal-transduction protein with cAMP-binding, CBS, and nucleotidyltransferase domain
MKLLKSLSEARVSDLAKRPLVILDCDKTIQELASTMADKHVSAVLLADSGKTIGIVTERDLARQVCAKGLAPEKTPVTALMSAPVVTVQGDASLQDAAEQMVKNGVRHLAVKDEKQELVGMITATDFAWYAARKVSGKSNVLELLYPYEAVNEEIP